MIRRRGDGGQSTVLVMAVIAVVVAVCGALVELGSELVVRGRAQAVADLAALAATWGDDRAGTVARRNGAVLVSASSPDGARTEVVVDLDGHRAVAVAER